MTENAVYGQILNNNAKPLGRNLPEDGIRIRHMHDLIPFS
jgi:hypothetical protein